jgi:hypothetical protein
LAEAALKDAANTFVNTLQLGLNQGAAELNTLGATVDQVAKAFASINQTPNAIRDALKFNGFPDPQISQAIQRAFPGIPHVDTAAVPRIDVGAKPHVDIAGAHTDVGATHTNLSTGGHADRRVVGVHVDTNGPHSDFSTAHVDNIITPHVNVAPTAHIDVPATLHVDTP